MVSKKRLNFGFNAHRAPVIPRAPRSIRSRGPHKKSVEDSKLSAFELLAAVAGKLLQESESSASSNVAEGKLPHGVFPEGVEKVEPKDGKAVKSESFDNGSCAESAFLPETSVQERNFLSNFKEVPPAENGYVTEHTSAHATSDFYEKVDCDMKLGICEDKNSDGNTTCKFGGSGCIGNSFIRKVESGSDVQSLDEKNQICYFSMANITTVNDPIGECVNTNVLINSDSSVKSPVYRDPSSGALLQKHSNNVKLGIRDDDENSLGNKFSPKSRSFRPQTRIKRHRVRKMITAKYWKAAPELTDCELENINDGMKSFSHCRKSIYARENCQRSPLKKRKLSDRRFSVAYDKEHSSDSISKIPEDGMRGGKSSSAKILHRASGASATAKGYQNAHTPHVKFTIKSLKVPELYIEVPETATVGSLKRSVMEAVTAVLGGEMRVGVVFQGKKVRDDFGTLLQAGISQCSDLDNLGFTLEPSFTHVTPLSVTPKKLSILSPCDANRPLQRPLVTPKIDSGNSKASFDPQPVTKLDGVDNEFISFPKTPDDTVMDVAVPVPESKTFVSVPSVNVEAHALVPANPKAKRNELSQRRIRRPFSVLEVEALIAAVEKLGTGRWREVKLRAFENADHRTYVDLKDKWKTLVHTAGISPQQRRGEPVPPELLNRVLSAHSYWSQNLSKQHGKDPVESLKIEVSREEIESA